MTFGNASSRARRRIKQNDILIATVRPNLKNHFLVRTRVKDCIGSTELFRFKVSRKCIRPLFYYHLFGYIVSQQIDRISTGSNYPAINKNDIMKIKIPSPRDYKEQIAIAQILSDMDLEIEALERKRDKCKLLKVGLMQQLLTGRIRLKCQS